MEIISRRMRYTVHKAFMGEINCRKIKAKKPYSKRPFK
jgi:hypothetical protein